MLQARMKYALAHSCITPDEGIFEEIATNITILQYVLVAMLRNRIKDERRNFENHAIEYKPSFARLAGRSRDAMSKHGLAITCYTECNTRV